LGKIAADKEERMAGDFSGRVAQTVAEVERGWMTPLTEAPESLERFPPVKLSESYRHHPEVAEKAVQQSLGFQAKSSRQYHPNLRESRGADTQSVRRPELFDQLLVAGLT
jgi:hypothetical protein